MKDLYEDETCMLSTWLHYTSINFICQPNYTYINLIKIWKICLEMEYVHLEVEYLFGGSWIFQHM